LFLVVSLWLSLAGAARAEPLGTAYLRSLPPPAAPFGQLVADTFPYDGVRLQRWRRDDPPVDWLLVQIDLRTPGLGYRISPIHYRTGPAGTPFQAAHAQHTLDFLKERADEPRVDLAVNAVAYWPFPAYTGTPVFLSEPVWSGTDNTRDPEPESWLLGLLPGRALIGETATVRAASPALALGAFRESGLAPLGLAVRDGQVQPLPSAPPHGRTLAGVSADNRVLFLLVADGYNPGVSSGLSARDAAQVLQTAGAHQAIFFDGGGSSTLVGRSEDGEAIVLNRPAGLHNRPGTLRPVALNLGFTNLQRSTDPLPALPDWQAPWYVVATHTGICWARVHPLRAAVLVLGALVVVAWLAWRWWRRSAVRQAASG